MCPYCGCNCWHNSWGKGNSCCAECGKEFNIVFIQGNMVGVPLRVSEPVRNLAKVNEETSATHKNR